MRNAMVPVDKIHYVKKIYRMQGIRHIQKGIIRDSVPNFCERERQRQRQGGSRSKSFLSVSIHILYHIYHLFGMQYAVTFDTGSETLHV